MRKIVSLGGKCKKCGEYVEIKLVAVQENDSERPWWQVTLYCLACLGGGAFIGWLV